MNCKLCGYAWSFSKLKSEGVIYFSLPGFQKIVELDGRTWEITFNDSGEILDIQKCKLCPILLGSETED